MTPTYGSPPRAWGGHAYGGQPDGLGRFTPTGVGSQHHLQQRYAPLPRATRPSAGPTGQVQQRPLGDYDRLFGLDEVEPHEVEVVA